MYIGSVFDRSCSVDAQSGVKARPDTEIAEHGKMSRLNRRDILEISADDRFYKEYRDYGGYPDPKEFGNSLRYRYSHTIGHTSTWFFQVAGETLQKAKGGKEDYDGIDLVNSYGFAYGTLYAEIDKRYENSQEQWFDIGGMPLTKEKEIEYLNAAYEAAVAFQVSSARVMAGLRQLNGQMPETPQKDIEELENIFCRSRDKYRALYKEGKLTGEPMAVQRFSFGNSALLALLV